MIVIADPGEPRRLASESARLAGGTIAAELAWGEAPERLGEQALIGAILVEAADVADDLLAATLPRVDTLARTLAMPVVVAMTPAQIDLVFSILSGPQVHLLCDATIADRVGALMTAGALVRGGLSDVTGDSADAARLRRLNEEVARIADVLARLAAGDGDPVSARVGERARGYGAPPGETSASVTAPEVRNAIRARRMRELEFGPGWFEDPAWDMMLDLLAAELEDARVSVSSLCIAAAVAPTTALRWIAKLTEADLLERQPDPLDRRRAFMALSAKARSGLHRYCGAVKRAGLSIA